MKIFNTFADAIAYQPLCVICNAPMDIITDFGAHDNKHYVDITTSLQSNCTISFNPSSNNIIISNIEYNLSIGTLYKGITIRCLSCESFSYLLRLKIDIRNLKISEIALNSECITIDDGYRFNEINNNYSLSYTEYIECNGTYIKAVLPLIPLSLRNPQETINRIKRLLIFT